MNIFEQIMACDNIKNKKNIDEYNNTFEEETFEDIGLGRFSSAVPWDQNSARATQSDFDNDGIVDALDNYFGQGAYSRW